MWNMVYTAESKQRSEADDEIEPEIRFKKYHYFILGRGYDQDLNLVFDSRTNNNSNKKQKSCENPVRTRQADDDTSMSNAESLSTGDDGLTKARDSVTLYSETQIGSDNRQETSASGVQRKGDATARSPVRKLSVQIDFSSGDHTFDTCLSYLLNPDHMKLTPFTFADYRARETFGLSQSPAYSDGELQETY